MTEPNPDQFIVDVGEWDCINCGGEMSPSGEDAAKCRDCGFIEYI